MMATRAGRTQTLPLVSRLGTVKMDPKTKFSAGGVTYKARFVGSEEIMDKSGDKIAQAAIGRIRSACREAGGVKPKVLINLSVSGIRVADLKTKVWSINVPIPRLTYVAKDADDSCVFCIVVARKNTGFKLFVYKAEQRIAAQIVQSIRELFQLVYKMYQNKKQKDGKSKSAATLPRNTSNTVVARVVSDSKLLDPPPEQDFIDPIYSMADYPTPPGDAMATEQEEPPFTQEELNLVDVSTGEPQQQTDIYAVPFANKTRSHVAPNQYQVPTSNKPAFPEGYYQVPSNRPASPDDRTDAAKEWSTLDEELTKIAQELNMFGGNNTSTPDHERPAQQQSKLSDVRTSTVDPFQNDFFDQPFYFDQDKQRDDPFYDGGVEEFETSDPFSSPETSVHTSNLEDITTSDDPFTMFEFDSPKTLPTAKYNHNDKLGMLAELLSPDGDTQSPAIGVRSPVSNPGGINPQVLSKDPFSDITTKKAPEKAQMKSWTTFDASSFKSTSSTANEDILSPAIPPDPLGIRGPVIKPQVLPKDPFSDTTKEDKVKNWTTFDTNASLFESTSGTNDDKAKKRSSMFEGSFSSKQHDNQSSEQIVSPLQPPPQNRRSSRKRSSRPYTVYGGESTKTQPQPTQTSSNTKRFDLASIKPKSPTKESVEIDEDPLMEIFNRMPNTAGLQYESTHL